MPEYIGPLLTMAGTIVGTAVALTWWLSKQFTDVKDVCNSRMSKHEHEVDIRFNRLEMRDMQIMTLLDSEGLLSEQYRNWNFGGNGGGDHEH